nr:uncharacterized protein LOC112941263 [Solanum lycopersicum]
MADSISSHDRRGVSSGRRRKLLRPASSCKKRRTTTSLSSSPPSRCSRQWRATRPTSVLQTTVAGRATSGVNHQPTVTGSMSPSTSLLFLHPSPLSRHSPPPASPLPLALSLLPVFPFFFSFSFPLLLQRQVASPTSNVSRRQQQQRLEETAASTPASLSSFFVPSQQVRLMSDVDSIHISILRLILR